jgi:transcriptional regulator with XRE-family HTH domain
MSNKIDERREVMKLLLKEIREKKGITQDELAEKSGISRATISKLENEVTVFNSQTLSKLADALDTPVSKFFVQ